MGVGGGGLQVNYAVGVDILYRELGGDISLAKSTIGVTSSDS